MKPKISSMRNLNGYYSIAFKKTQPLMKLLVDVLIELNEDPHYYDDLLKYDKLKKKDVFRNIKDFNDYHYHLSSKNINLDIIFGEKKVYLLAHIRSKKPMKIIKLITDNSEWIKPNIR